MTLSHIFTPYLPQTPAKSPFKPAKGRHHRARHIGYLLASLAEDISPDEPVFFHTERDWEKFTSRTGPIIPLFRQNCGMLIAEGDASLVLCTFTGRKWHVIPLVFHFNAYASGKTGPYLNRELATMDSALREPETLLDWAEIWLSKVGKLTDGFGRGQVAPWFRTKHVDASYRDYYPKENRLAELLGFVHTNLNSISLRCGLIKDWQGEWLIPPKLRITTNGYVCPSIREIVEDILEQKSQHIMPLPSTYGQTWNWYPYGKSVKAIPSATTYRSPGHIDLGFSYRSEKRAFVKSLSSHDRMLLISELLALDPRFSEPKVLNSINSTLDSFL